VTGTLVISLDAELAWGFHDVDPPAERIAEARLTWERLVALFDRYDVPATWAVVGHLFLDDCDGGHADHPAGERPCTRDLDDGDSVDDGDAVDDDGSTFPGDASLPGHASLSADRAWYAADLVETVRRADADHEIGAHGFTHVHFDHERMSESFARRELQRCREAAAAAGVGPDSFDSFVFPVNRVGYRDHLAEFGFGCYRGREPTADRSAHARRAGKVIGAVLDRGAPPVVRPEIDEHGLVNVPASMYLFDGLGALTDVAERVRDDPVARRAERGVDAAADGDGVCHLWFHPHDVTEPKDFDRLRRVLERARERRADGDLTVATMGQVADRVRSARPQGGAV